MNEQQQKVNDLVARIERHQAALKLSDVRFVARYQRYLGSPKTWKDRLVARAWADLGASLEKWQRKLEAFVAEIDGANDLTEFFDAMPIARYGQAVYDILQGQRSDRRVAWLIGPTGVGKSWTMRRLAIENPTTTVYIHVPPRGKKSWERMTSLSRLFARAMGVTEESSGANTFVNVVESLKSNPMTLVIDDVHEGGVLMLKLCKHLVDDTRTRFILGTYPTGWNALVNGSTDGHSEAQQLIGRSLKPIEKRWLKGVTMEDATAYLKLAMGGNGECRILAEKIAPTLQRNGNLRALADAMDLARMNADDAGEELNATLVEEAVAQVCPTIGEKK